MNNSECFPACSLTPLSINLKKRPSSNAHRGGFREVVCVVNCALRVEREIIKFRGVRGVL